MMIVDGDRLAVDDAVAEVRRREENRDPDRAASVTSLEETEESSGTEEDEE